MKYHYEGTQTLSFDGVLLVPGLNVLSEEHNAKLSAHPKFVAMKKEGVVKDHVAPASKKSETVVEVSEPSFPSEAVETDVKIKKKK